MILVTGFQSYGGRSVNPSQAVAEALDGASVGGTAVHGRTLPVDFRAMVQQMPALIDDIAPRLILSLGLWPGEPMVRIERVAANWALFELPDNTGHRQNGAVIAGAPDGYLTTLPADRMQAAVRRAGIPCRQSGSAGSYLCNATAYVTLHHCAAHHPGTLAGFVHLPYLSQQVAQMLDQVADDGTLEMHQRADLASMSLEVMVRAVTVALESAVEDVGL